MGRNLITVLFWAICSSAAAQVPEFSKVPNLWEDDSAHIVHLIEHGVRVERKHVIAWFPRDALAPVRIKGLMDTLEAGTKAAIDYTGSPKSWQAHDPGTPYTFYFPDARLISHGSGAGFVSIPLSRIMSGRAPWLHELLHEVLFSKMAIRNFDRDSGATAPLWLMEGLPDHIAMEISGKCGFHLFDVLTDSAYLDPDISFVRDMRNPRAAEVLSAVGTAEDPRSLLFGNDRSLYAGVFYHLSASFVKFLAGRYGIDKLMESNAASPNELATLERMMHSTLAQEKAAWLKSLSVRQQSGKADR